MTKHYFDQYGWLSQEAIEGRATDIPPPTTTLPDGTGWNFTGTTWVAAPFSPPLHGAATTSRLVSVGSFFDRFGTDKWQLLADPNPLVQALVKDCSVRKFIDLDRPDLRQALQLLVGAGHAIDPEQILGAPVTPGEQP